jgi:uncharacterized protein (TIGR02246 family)
VKTRYDTPLEAEAAFYAAFSHRDLDAMMDVWDDAPDVVCVHPMGTMLVGREAIREAWQAIFRNGPALTFLIEERVRRHEHDLAIHIVHEHVRVPSETMRPPMSTTNAYRLTADGWRMILHHASPPARASAEPAAPTYH